MLHNYTPQPMSVDSLSSTVCFKNYIADVPCQQAPLCGYNGQKPDLRFQADVSSNVEFCPREMKVAARWVDQSTNSRSNWRWRTGSCPALFRASITLSSSGEVETSRVKCPATSLHTCCYCSITCCAVVLFCCYYVGLFSVTTFNLCYLSGLLLVMAFFDITLSCRSY